jgi:hypothetical protein
MSISWSLGAVRVRLYNAKMKSRQRYLSRCTSKWLTIKTNVCPVWGLKARAAMRAQEQGK